MINYFSRDRLQKRAEKLKQYKVERDKIELKGKANGYCNRGACLRPDRIVYKHRLSDFYYCQSCAFMINKANMDYDGKDLCVLDNEADHYDRQERELTNKQIKEDAFLVEQMKKKVASDLADKVTEAIKEVFTGCTECGDMGLIGRTCTCYKGPPVEIEEIEP